MITDTSHHAEAARDTGSETPDTGTADTGVTVAARAQRTAEDATVAGAAGAGAGPFLAAELDSPIGRLTVVASDRGVRSIHWTGDRPDVPLGTSDVLTIAVAQLEEYFRGDRTDFDLPLDPVGTEFQRSAWNALTTIPFGETVSYGEQARRLGDPNKARAVGAANSRNPIPIVVPCHRVVGSDGSLTGFAGGMDAKRWLLDHESRASGRTLL